MIVKGDVMTLKRATRLKFMKIVAFCGDLTQVWVQRPLIGLALSAYTQP